jgi:hypothetical protein
MYKKPLRDLGFIGGHELLQVCVGRYDVILNFDQALSISIQGSFSVGGAEAGELPHGATALFDLLSLKVVEASMDQDANAALVFSNEKVLLILNDSEQYEAYRIVAPGHDVIV